VPKLARSVDLSTRFDIVTERQTQCHSIYHANMASLLGQNTQ